jgi:hypothetical protein
MAFRSKRLLVTALSIAGVVAAGCGGGGDAATGTAASTATSNPTTVKTPTKAEFLAQANAACRKVRTGLAQRVARFERGGEGGKTEPLADAVHFVFLPTIEAQVFEIEKLGAPAGQAEQINHLLDAERDAIDRVAVKPRVASVAIAEKQFGEPNRLFKAYGLSACATDGVHRPS